MFALLGLQSKTVVVDDDEPYILALSDLFPVHLNGVFCLHPSGVDRVLGQQKDLLRHEQERLAMLDPALDRAVLSSALSYLDWVAVQSMFSVLVTDQVMPAETGVELCERYGDHEIRRILLTGAADADLAVRAFNAGLIEHFIPKQMRGLFDYLVDVIERQQRVALDSRSMRIRQMLSSASSALFEDAGASAALKAICVSHHVIEYVVVPSPLGVMGRCGGRKFVWIQIEEQSALQELQGVVMDRGWDSDQVRAMVQHNLIPNLDLESQVSGVAPAFSPGRPIGAGFVAGVFPFAMAGESSC